MKSMIQVSKTEMKNVIVNRIGKTAMGVVIVKGENGLPMKAMKFMNAKEEQVILAELAKVAA